MRALGAHRYESTGLPLDRARQLMDSIGQAGRRLGCGNAEFSLERKRRKRLVNDESFPPVPNQEGSLVSVYPSLQALRLKNGISIGLSLACDTTVDENARNKGKLKMEP
jgi:hypothetical protein